MTRNTDDTPHEVADWEDGFPPCKHDDVWEIGCERCEECAQYYYAMSVAELLATEE